VRRTGGKQFEKQGKEHSNSSRGFQERGGEIFKSNVRVAEKKKGGGRVLKAKRRERKAGRSNTAALVATAFCQVFDREKEGGSESLKKRGKKEDCGPQSSLGGRKKSFSFFSLGCHQCTEKVEWPLRGEI